MKRLSFVSLLLLAWSPSMAQSAPPVQQEPRMVVRGDQEAPLVMFVVPWQEPKTPAMPGASMLVLWPKVLDHERSFVDEPVNRWPGGGISAGADGKKR